MSWVFFSFWWFWITLFSRFMCRFLYENKFSKVWVKARITVLDILFSKELQKYLPKWLYNFILLPAITKYLLLLLKGCLYFQISDYHHSNSCIVVLIALLICNYPITNDIEPFFIWLYKICISLVRCLFIFFDHFLICFFYFCSVEFCCIFWTPFSYIGVFQIICPSLYLICLLSLLTSFKNRNF